MGDIASDTLKQLTQYHAVSDGNQQGLGSGGGSIEEPQH